MTAAAFNRDLLADLVDAAADGIIVADATGTVVYWNAGAERIFGWPAAEVLGAGLDMIIPERLRERHNTGFSAAVATGRSRYGAADLLAVPAVTRDGRTISIEFTIALLAGGGAIRHVAAVVRDVTERRARDQELRRRMAELEAAAGGKSP